MLSDDQKDAMEQGFREEMERQLDDAGVTDPKIRQGIIEKGVAGLHQGTQHAVQEQLAGRNQAAPPRKKKRGCLGCFAAIVGCLLVLAILALVSRPNFKGTFVGHVQLAAGLPMIPANVEIKFTRDGRYFLATDVGDQWKGDYIRDGNVLRLKPGDDTISQGTMSQTADLPLSESMMVFYIVDNGNAIEDASQGTRFERRD